MGRRPGLPVSHHLAYDCKDANGSVARSPSHSTSHGIGSFLNVHEGPQGVGQRPAYNDVAMEDGMVISNEPGYYAEGKFGIRIENVDVVKRAETRENFGNKGYLELERVTMVSNAGEACYLFTNSHDSHYCHYCHYCLYCLYYPYSYYPHLELELNRPFPSARSRRHWCSPDCCPPRRGTG